MINRNTLSIYASGNGIEIGAYHNPFPFDKGRATVTYVDKWPTEVTRKMADNDPNLGPYKSVVKVDIVDDGETLKTIPDNSQDFVISSHQLEHCVSPLTAIENHVRICKQGGKVIYAIPDKRFTFDRDRCNSDWQHVLLDYSLTRDSVFAGERLIAHYDDYLEKVDKITDPERRKAIAVSYIGENRDVHFHAWDEKATLNMFTEASKLFQSFELEIFSRAGHENFVMLKKL
jgi:SAM-dependent methyltransferase